MYFSGKHFQCQFYIALLHLLRYSLILSRSLSRDNTVLSAHPEFHRQAEWAIPAFALVLVYRPRRDGRLSRPWCEVAPAKIWTYNLPIANPALCHTVTSAPNWVLILLSSWDSISDHEIMKISHYPDVSLLVVMIWLELCTTYSSSSSSCHTTSIILCFNKHQLTQVHLENGR